jgi:hypothetical protein
VSNTQAAKELPFVAIFPDTNIFLPSWPGEPPGLADLLSTAGIFNIPVYLLETVEMELEAHWIREMRSSVDKLKSAMRKLPAPLHAVTSLQFPNDTDAIDLYKTAAEKMKATLGLPGAGFPDTSLKYVFQMAINHEHPFAAEGKNFQDVVILQSVIEFCKREKLPRVAFVSKNQSDFDPDKVKKRAAADGIDLQYFRDLHALHDSVWPFVSELFREAWRKDNELAKVGIRAISRNLEEFLRSQLIRSDDVQLSLLNIEDVSVAWWDKVTQKLERVPVQITVNVEFSDRDFKIDRGITVEGWAMSSENGYEKFEFDSATITG